MPPINRQQPKFSPYGRYLLDVQERKQEGANYFHDTQSSRVECGIESIPSGSISRFNNRAWAVQRGYQPCRYCG